MISERSWTHHIFYTALSRGGAPQKSGGARKKFSAGDFRRHFVTLHFQIASGATVVIHCIVGNVHNKKLLHKIIYICTIIYN